MGGDIAKRRQRIDELRTGNQRETGSGMCDNHVHYNLRTCIAIEELKHLKNKKAFLGIGDLNFELPAWELTF